MLRPLTKTERKRIRQKYEAEKHPLFLACDTVFMPRAAHLNGVVVESEQVFCAVGDLLDNLYQAEDELTQQFVDNLWLKLFMDVRQLKPDASENDKLKITHTVFSIVRKLLCHRWEPVFSNTLFDMLTQTIEKETRKIEDDEEKKFLEQLLEFSDGMDEWINHVYNGHLSDEIEAVIKGHVSDTEVPKPGRGRKAKEPKNIVETFNYDYYKDDRGMRLQLFYEALRLKYIMKDTDQKGFIDLFQNATTTFKVVWTKEIVALKYLINKIQKFVKLPKGYTKWDITCAHFQIRIRQNETVGNKKEYSYIITNLERAQFGKGKKQPDKIEDLDKIISILDPQTDYGRAYQEYLDAKEEHDEIKDKEDAFANGLNTDIRV